MKQVGIRELRTHISSFLKDLPFEITKNGKVVAVVSPPKKFNDPSPIEYLKTDDAKKHILKSETVDFDDFDNQNIEKKPSKTGWCKAHFERNVEYPLQEVEYRDENDNVIFSGLACPKCIKKFKSKDGEIKYV
jgi:antitoxin (DNA-binding transcriptional repressor) of toxin-antitoxin stability system